MKKVLFIVSIILAMFINVSCTENYRAREFGGTVTIHVEKGKKVMMATWKGEDLFYMVEDMEDDYVPHNKKLIESSAYGIIESNVIFVESR